jgi:hypothetical protein
MSVYCCRLPIWWSIFNQRRQSAAIVLAFAVKYWRRVVFLGKGEYSEFCGGESGERIHSFDERRVDTTTLIISTTSAANVVRPSRLSGRMQERQGSD